MLKSPASLYFEFASIKVQMLKFGFEVQKAQEPLSNQDFKYTIHHHIISFVAGSSFAQFLI